MNVVELSVREAAGPDGVSGCERHPEMTSRGSKYGDTGPSAGNGYLLLFFEFLAAHRICGVNIARHRCARMVCGRLCCCVGDARCLLLQSSGAHAVVVGYRVAFATRRRRSWRNKVAEVGTRTAGHSLPQGGLRARCSSTFRAVYSGARWFFLRSRRRWIGASP